MWFLHKRRFKELVDEKKAQQQFIDLQPELEKNDIRAMILGALLAFLPGILVLAGIILFFAWMLSR